jgi:hypothetical protein
VSCTDRHRFDLSGLTVAIGGTERDVVDGLAGLWTAFRAGEPVGATWLQVSVEAGSADDALDGASAEKGLEIRRTRDGGIAVRMSEGRALLDPGGSRARVVVAPRASREARTWAGQNLLLPVLAWALALRRGGGVVHGAAVVLDRRAFLLVGPEGAGKSTFARVAVEQGENVLGEDLALIDAADGRVQVLASPFRVENATGTGPGRWPLAAVLVPRHADRPAVEAVSRLHVVSMLSANLPYLDPEAAVDVADGVLDRVPARRLAFRPDPSFLDPLCRFGASDGPGR